MEKEWVLLPLKHVLDSTFIKYIAIVKLVVFAIKLHKKYIIFLSQ